MGHRPITDRLYQSNNSDEADAKHDHLSLPFADGKVMHPRRHKSVAPGRVVPRSDQTSDDPGIVRLHLQRALPCSRTCLVLDGNPFVFCHDAEIHLPVREDHDDSSPNLNEYRVGRLRGLTGHAADFRIVGLGPPRIGNTGIYVNDDFHAIRLEGDDQLASGRPPMLAELWP